MRPTASEKTNSPNSRAPWAIASASGGRRVASPKGQLGEHCGLRRAFIGSVERGERNLSILNLRLIARVRRVKLSDLLDEAPAPRSSPS
jgi:hypothetical protein